MLVLVCIETVSNDYQHTTKVAMSRQIVKLVDFRHIPWPVVMCPPRLTDHLKIKKITLYLVIDSSFWFDTINMGVSIKG